VEFVYPEMQPRTVDLARVAPKPVPPKTKPVPKKPPKVASKKHKRTKPVQPRVVATQAAPATVAALPGIQPTKEKFKCGCSEPCAGGISGSVKGADAATAGSSEA